MDTLFETHRLCIRRAQPDEADTAFFLRLWNDPQVMRNVGFPYGLRLDAAEVRQALERGPQQGDERHLDACLVAVHKDTGQVIGECRLGTPDAQGLSETDVKLLPELWGQGYGTEVKRGLLAYLFTRTECLVAQATPNVDNPASVRMQEAVGGRRVGESTHEFPPEMQSFTCPVHCYVYQVRREDWLKDHPPGTP
jgi:RimJ/RimL family protein N-acetyltransferase